MPLVLIVAVVALAVMYFRFRTTRLSRNCRWRRDGDDGAWLCAFCGAKTRLPAGEQPRTCLRRPDR